MKIQNSQYISQLQENLLNQTANVGSKTKTSGAINTKASGATNTKAPGVTNAQGLTFQQVLDLKNGQTAATGSAELKFSKHASNRLSDRNIDLSTEQLERLNEGAKRAGDKGIKESLIMVDRLAFIVNIPNNTVVTTMDSTNTNENIFTNIDGAVIA